MQNISGKKFDNRHSGGIVQSVDRALLILNQLAARGGCAALSDLARDLGYSRSTVHGLLATLMMHGMVAQDANRNYVLGIKLFELGSQAVSRLDLRQTAGPILQRLVEEFEETVHLVVGYGLDVVYIDKRESPQSMRIVSQVGQRLPAYCTSVGKAMIAYLPQAELDRLLSDTELTSRTSRTIVDRDQLKMELEQVRRQGYAMDNAEFAEGLICVGAPIWDYTNQVIAALSISGPSVRMNETKTHNAIQAVRKGAAEISRQLGYNKA